MSLLPEDTSEWLKWVEWADGVEPLADATRPRSAFDPALRILVVDDDEGCRQCLASVLADDGHRIHTASRGFEAVEFARRLRRENDGLDLSILDFNMPDLTGIETFQRLSVEFPGLQAVFVSGDPSESLVESIRSVGGRALVRKPLDLDRIRRVVYSFQSRGGLQGI